MSDRATQLGDIRVLFNESDGEETKTVLCGRKSGGMCENFAAMKQILWITEPLL